MAAAVMTPFIGADIPADVFASMCDEAYASFRHEAVVPLVQLGADHWLLEQFHGPTMSFKDIALQLVGRLFDHVLTRRGERVCVVGATSGDTGSAAIDAVKGCKNVDIVILYPAGRVSEVQRRQMTTVASSNVRTVAVDGTFDDCQDLVKAMFNDHVFRDQMNLAAVNSINWARIMAQTVYYVTSCRALGATADRPVTFSVPTGNFGNILSGWIAKRMGAPIDRLMVASNSNDILTRFVTGNDMSSRPVIATVCPSMDIQVSSNFERLLFEMLGRDGERTAQAMEAFRRTGTLPVPAELVDTWITPTFSAASFDDREILAEIARIYETTGELIDPHTATGTAAVHSMRLAGGAHTAVTLATAHPAKFANTVFDATGIWSPLPAHLAGLSDLPERTNSVGCDLEAVKTFVAAGR